ncbi:ACT domain-containing protein [Nocardioides alcanivorans]|uniref:ACT domain-containing protein n=1 Tax=Nocardioides alcanivorans TaxID=2897352 RepID=UPI001F369394|nr:ACT domain-containing protein [Nocardioides alcanivorans]
MSAAAEQIWTLEQFPEQLAVVSLGPGAEVPAWAESSSIFSVTATAHGTTVVCAGRNVPNKAVSHKPLTGFAIKGRVDLNLTGVLVGLLTPLAEAEIPVFTVATYDTDWILVPKERAEAAAEEWRRRGHTVAPAVPVKPNRKRPNK